MLGATLKDRFRKAVALHQTGAVDEAEAIYRDLLRDAPRHAGAWHLLGMVLFSRRDLRGALDHVQKALALCDIRAAYWNNLGAILKDLGEFTEARHAFEKAISLQDAYPDAWSNLGLVQSELGLHQDAERSLRYALRLAPRHVDALRHLAALYREKGDYEEALRLCRDAASVAPAREELLVLEGALLTELKRFEEAADAYQRVVARNPRTAQTHLSLGRAYEGLDETEKAKACFEKAASLRPDRPMWRLRHLSLCPMVFQAEAEISEYRDNLERQLDEVLADPPPMDWRLALEDGFVPSFQLAHHGACSRRLKEKFARLFAPHFPQGRPKCLRRGKIRVGFLCTRGQEGGFSRGYGGIMERLDRSRFEVVGLVANSIEGVCREKVRSDDIRWIGFPGDLPGAFSTIRNAECDVVAHRHSGTNKMNYFLPFLPLAPIQTIGSGMHGTTGNANIDFGISSRLFERGEEASEDYSESLVQFEGLNSWQRRPQLAAPASRADFGLPASGAVYFCPQRVIKLLPSFDRIVRRVLERDTSGHVVLLSGRHPQVGERLRHRLEDRLGQTLSKRLHLLPSQRPREYYRLLSLATAVLDAPNYSTSYTGYDALGLGVPVVTMPGRLMVQRYALGLYRRMDLLELVATSEQQYVDLAVRLGREPDFSREMRHRIREQSDPLFENDAVVREYETFFEQAIYAIR